MVTTRTESESVVWSPDGNKLAYFNAHGLQAHISEPHTPEAHTLHLSGATFLELDWSPNSHYLAARAARGGWVVFAFEGTSACELYHVAASSVAWIEDERLIAVLEAGGLQLIELGNSPRIIPLAV